MRELIRWLTFLRRMVRLMRLFEVRDEMLWSVCSLPVYLLLFVSCNVYKFYSRGCGQFKIRL